MNKSPQQKVHIRETLEEPVLMQGTLRQRYRFAVRACILYAVVGIDCMITTSQFEANSWI